MQEEVLSFSNCTIINQELFFVETQHGLPARMNPDNGDVSYCNIMENYLLKKGDIIDDIRTLEGCAYALETSGENIIRFDLEKLQCQHIPLQCAWRKWGNFVAFEQYGSSFYIFPRYGNKICIMNIFDNKISEIFDFFDGISELQCSCRVGCKVWLIPCGVAAIGCYDLSKRKMQIYELDRKIDNCVMAVSAEESIYILNRSGIIYKWDMYELKLDEVRRIEAENRLDKSLYAKIIYAADKLIILPALADHIKILDLRDGTIEVYRDYPEDFFYYDIEYMKEWTKYQGMCEDDNYYYMAMRHENYLLKISKGTGMLLWVKPHMPLKKDRIKIQTPLRERTFKKFFEEGERFFLETYVDIGNFLTEVPQREYIVEKTNIGKEIFEKIKRWHCGGNQ
ncbi:hypothetical protein C807_02825 [Lachnospiraceae bacterium 28-4]|nr:hypothetical protein C807_02825 [Lachnospiraceae bacterium 28-4]